MDAAVFLTVFLLAAAAIGVAVLAMSIGSLFGRRCLRGSCGGAAGNTGEDERIACDACPNRPRTSTRVGADGADGPADASARRREAAGPQRA